MGRWEAFIKSSDDDDDDDDDGPLTKIKIKRSLNGVNLQDLSRVECRR